MPPPLDMVSKLSAIHKYLSLLRDYQLVSPSIGKPYPTDLTDENSIIHRSHLDIQSLRLRKLNAEISSIKDSNSISSEDILNGQTYKETWKRLKRKVHFLVSKFQPQRLRSFVANKRKMQNSKSRERYKIRKFRKACQIIKDKDSVINLSSTTLTPAQYLVLSLGSGFIPSSTNKEKEEEILMLEGLRVIDRIGTLDSILQRDNQKENVVNRDTMIIDSNIDPQPSAANHDSFANYTEFTRDRSIPKGLKIHQPQERILSQGITKLMKKEFLDENNRLINLVRSKKKSSQYDNMPKKLRVALKELSQLVRDKIIDIRKVDKGDTILIIDFEERKKIEYANISKIAKQCEKQESNWSDNRAFVEQKMRELYELKFMDQKELTVVTGLLPGGVSGKLKNNDGSLKFTHALDMNEFFSRQDTPYIYPLLKAHKLRLEELKTVKPDEVCDKIPARLVVGMSSCQMSRVQAWLESFLTPLSKLYGMFEYTKDSNDILNDFDKINRVAESDNWNFSDIILFAIDVQALYPSIMFEYLKLALNDCFDRCTQWSQSVKSSLVHLIMYTLENQQLLWNNTYYMLNKGIPTGGIHCVPLANIFLSFLILDLLRSNDSFREQFSKYVKLWKRYIDDCGGVFLGATIFESFFKTLEEQFNKFGLQLTCETSKEKLHLLDIEVFIADNKFHTKEHRKETASSSYIRFGSAHPNHCFKGIIKSQMYRLRRLCSRNSDFMHAIRDLKDRCLNSNYDKELVEGILAQATSLDRDLSPRNVVSDDSNIHTIRWVTLSGSSYGKQICDFTRNINSLLSKHRIKIEVVNTTGSSLSQLLFNNREKYETSHICSTMNCSICSNNLRPDSNTVVSTSGRKYHIDTKLNCHNCGIYRILCPCVAGYTGKTTGFFNKRFDEHFLVYKDSSVFDHTKVCQLGNRKDKYSVQFLENCLNRGKYTLSEREYLWNQRLGGELNAQKVLRK